MKKQIFILFGFLIIILLSGCAKPSYQQSQQKCEEVEVPYEVQEEYMKTEYYTETVPYTDTECENVRLKYEVEYITPSSKICKEEMDECTKYVLGICVSKKTYCIDAWIACATDIYNYDDEAGRWVIRLILKDRNTGQVMDTLDEYIMIDEHSSSKDKPTANSYGLTSGILSSFHIIGKEDNLRSFNCDYEIIDSPAKQVCKDVTKYKEVQKERQVTAYKPVTKYRTETECS